MTFSEFANIDFGYEANIWEEIPNIYEQKNNIFLALCEEGKVDFSHLMSEQINDRGGRSHKERFFEIMKFIGFGRIIVESKGYSTHPAHRNQVVAMTTTGLCIVYNAEDQIRSVVPMEAYQIEKTFGSFVKKYCSSEKGQSFYEKLCRKCTANQVHNKQNCW